MTHVTGCRTIRGIDDDDLFLDLMESVTLDVLERTGDDPDPRYEFFRRFLALAEEIVRDRGRQPGVGAGH